MDNFVILLIIKCTKVIVNFFFLIKVDLMLLYPIHETPPSILSMILIFIILDSFELIMYF